MTAEAIIPALQLDSARGGAGPNQDVAVRMSRTPFRISFFGGGTDYPDWYMEHGGAVLSTTIDKYCYITARHLPMFFQTRFRIVWSHIETVWSISEILHPAVRHGIRYAGFDDSTPLEIHHQGDLPARAGMGSSSSFVVGLLNCLMRLQGKALSDEELARQAMDLEHNVMAEPVGSQDQIAAAYGGFNRIVFEPGGAFRVEQVTASAGRLADLEEQLMLFYLGNSRLSSEVTRDIVRNIAAKGDDLRAMRALVDDGWRILNGSGSLDEVGRLLDETWQRKRRLSDLVSNERVDSIYAAARRAGAVGGKLLGAGGTGFVLLYVPKECQVAVRNALAGFLEVPFGFEYNGSVMLNDFFSSSDDKRRIGHD